MSFGAFYLVRHGESTWNHDRRVQGHGEPPLTAKGLRQVQELARRIDRHSFDVLICSDLQRAMLTARAIAEVTGLAPDVRATWRERDMGAWTGLTREEIERRWPEEYSQYRSGDEALKPGGGESRLEFRGRILKARRDLQQQFDTARVLVVTHRGPIRVLLPDVRPAHAELLNVAAADP